MLDKSVAITFVNALLDVATEKGQFEQIEKDLDLVCEIISKHADLKKVLFHPSVSRSSKKELIQNVFDKSVSGLMMNFLSLLIDRRKEGILDFVTDVYKEVTHEKKGVLKATVQTVMPLSGERLEDFKKKLKKITGKTVELEVVQNPDILGGMVIQIGNKMIDGSVANRLKNLKNRLLSLRTA